jgi:hypothetical protein
MEAKNNASFDRRRGARAGKCKIANTKAFVGIETGRRTKEKVIRQYR